MRVALVGLVLLAACGEPDTPDAPPSPPLPPSPQPEREPCPDHDSPDDGVYDLLFVDWDDRPVVALGSSTRRGRRELLRLEGGIGGSGQVALGPDGHTIAYVSWASDAHYLYLYDLATGAKKRVTRLGVSWTLGRPSFSPDGSTIAFLVDGGRDQEIHTYELGSDAPELLTRVDSVAGPDCIRPSWSPAGDRVLFTGNGVRIVDVDTGAVEEIWPGPVCGASWSNAGDAVAFVADGLLRVVPLAGGPDLLRLGYTFARRAQIDWSPDDSRLAFVRYDAEHFDAALYTADLESGYVEQLALLTAGLEAGHPKWSPDGERIAYTRFHRGCDVAEVMTIAGDGGQPRSVSYLGAGIDAGHPLWLAEPLELDPE